MRSWTQLRVPAFATLLFLAVYAGIDAVADPGDRLYAFIYERSFVQPTTLFVACLVTALLCERLLTHRRKAKELNTAERNPDPPPQEILESLRAVCASRQAHGDSAALAHAQRMAEDRQRQLQKSYSKIQYLAGTIPALGLFGTMLGISDALFSAFSSGSLGPSSVQTFVASLSTAMDTTVLAMVCATPLFACVWSLDRLENDHLERFADYVRRRLGLDGFTPTDKTADAVRAELRSLSRVIAAEARASFESVLLSSAEAYRESLNKMLGEVLERERIRDENMVRQVADQTASHLAQASERLAAEIAAHNSRTAEAVTSQIAKLERALRSRTPEEVIIRYQHHHSTEGNGRCNGKELIHV